MEGKLTGGITTLDQRVGPTATTVARRILLDEGGRIMERAHARWPVDSGRSRDQLGVELLGNRAAVHLVCRVPYARAIRSARAKIPVGRRYVAEPAVRAARRIMREIGKDLLVELRRGR